MPSMPSHLLMLAAPTSQEMLNRCYAVAADHDYS
jgi:hypothetical protein